MNPTDPASITAVFVMTVIAFLLGVRYREQFLAAWNRFVRRAPHPHTFYTIVNEAEPRKFEPGRQYSILEIEDSIDKELARRTSKKVTRSASREIERRQIATEILIQKVLTDYGDGAQAVTATLERVTYTEEGTRVALSLDIMRAEKAL